VKQKKSDGGEELMAAAAALIAELSDHAGELTKEDCERLISLYRRAGEAILRSVDSIEVMLERAHQRGLPDHVPPVQALTERERADFDRSELCALDAERARAALYAWAQSAGLELPSPMRSLPKIDYYAALMRIPSGPDL
jgi:hypothetical protein